VKRTVFYEIELQSAFFNGASALL